MSRRRILFSAPSSNDEDEEDDDEMAEKEGETKYANINKEEGEEGRREGYEEAGAGGGPGTGDGAAAEMLLTGHISAHDRTDEK